MNPRYVQLERQFHQIQDRLADPSLAQGSDEYQRLARDFKKMDPINQKLQVYKKVLSDIESLRPLKDGDDREMRELARQELEDLIAQQQSLEKEFDDFLIPKDPQDDKDVIVEIRAGTGGDEAAIFAGDLLRAYTRYAAEKGFSVEAYSSNPTGLGGFKEIIFGIKGLGAYRHFKFESGVHRVQRVPLTEASGRVHTSTATVAVMSEADEVDIHIDPKDLRIDVYRSSGAGGQHVNKTESAVRITHIPTNVVVACQDERSQIKNRAKAMSLLRSKLYQTQQEKLEAERRDFRRSQVGTGERSEKIRTYNFPQDRITDHRINQNFHNLPAIMDGHLEDIVNSLLEDEKARRTAEAQGSPLP